MPPRISDEEKQRRKEGALAVLRDARDGDFRAVKDLEAHIGRELDITAGAARSLLSNVLNALPQGHALLRFDNDERLWHVSAGPHSSGPPELAAGIFPPTAGLLREVVGSGDGVTKSPCRVVGQQCVVRLVGEDRHGRPLPAVDGQVSGEPPSRSGEPHAPSISHWRLMVKATPPMSSWGVRRAHETELAGFSGGPAGNSSFSSQYTSMGGLKLAPSCHCRR